jgi:hypothetical protein
MKEKLSYTILAFETAIQNHSIRCYMSLLQQNCSSSEVLKIVIFIKEEKTVPLYRMLNLITKDVVR